jgi:hypothetical protein
MFANVTSSVPKTNQPVCAVAVDAEEDFDWDKPLASTSHSTDCMRRIPDLQEILGAYGIVPSYLLTYPVLEDDDVVHILRRQIRRGQCDVGVQLHPWVNPPFDDAPGAEQGVGTSFSGNLAPGLEERKLVALKQRFMQCFGTEPQIYRAGRYGLGRDTAQLLEKLGFTIDTSLAPRTSASDEGGPDHARYDYQLFWFGEQRRLLELPLCRSTVGWGGRLAPEVYRRLEAVPALRRWRIPGVVSRLRFAERITLSPEGNDVGAMLRLIRHLHSRGQTVFVLSFHSSSLAVGRNPYVRTLADLHGFYERLSAVLDFMSSRLGFIFAPVAALPSYMQPPEA